MFLSELTAGAISPRWTWKLVGKGYMLCVEGNVKLTDAAGREYHMEQRDAAELKGLIACSRRLLREGSDRRGSF